MLKWKALIKTNQSKPKEFLKIALQIQVSQLFKHEYELKNMQTNVLVLVLKPLTSKQHKIIYGKKPF